MSKTSQPPQRGLTLLSKLIIVAIIIGISWFGYTTFNKSATGTGKGMFKTVDMSKINTEAPDYAGITTVQEYKYVPQEKLPQLDKNMISSYKKLDKNKAYIIIGKHESTWDTLIMHTFMKPAPVFILKKELLWVPFFGWGLALASKIAIDRGGGATSVKKIIKEGKAYIKEGHNIIIFPQGTRVPPQSTIKDYPYKPGFIALIKSIGADIVPMALNSGNLWKKKQFLKPSGTITMKFLDPIKYEDIKDLSKEEIIAKIEKIIESESQKLNKDFE